MNIYLIINGSNDLYYPISESVENFLENINDIKDVNIYILCSLISSGERYIWKGKNNRITKNRLEVITKVDERIVINQNDECINKDNEYSINIALFLEKYYKNTDENVLIVSGHGGPFQSLLDMSIHPAKSISTFEFCTIIKKYKFDLVFFDMCAMNYIEVVYEALNKSKIKSLITYKNLAPFDGLNYADIINSIKNCKGNFKELLELKLPFIYLDKNSVFIIEKIKKMHNDMATKCFDFKIANYDYEIENLRRQMKIVAIEGKSAKPIQGMSLNYIKYYLKDYEDRCIYEDYKYSKGNKWRRIVIANNLYKKINYITLSKSSIKSIISLHNENMNDEQINRLVDSYINLRGEICFYKEGLYTQK